MASWPTMADATVRVPQPVPAQRRRPAAATPGVRTAGGVVWIVVVAALLGGIVALNVAVLQLNVRLEELGRARSDLVAENAALASRLSRTTAGPRIEALARARGLVRAEPDATIYVDLGRGAR